MATTLDRRSMIHAAAGTCAALVIAPLAAAQSKTPGARPDPLDGELVHEFVRVAHGDLERTRRMLDEEPRLIRATWDWGGGDFETALGGAGHMGRRDIAGFLLERGATFDLFPAAMLGRLAAVRAVLETQPSLIHVPGPHGIPLVAHARAGGAEAEAVLAYLLEFEQAHPQTVDSADAVEAASALGGVYAGVYRGTRDGKAFGYEITERGDSIVLAPLDGREPQEFAPAPGGIHRFELPKFGAVITFEVAGGRAVSLTAEQHGLVVRADRAE